MSVVQPRQLIGNDQWPEEIQKLYENTIKQLFNELESGQNVSENFPIVGKIDDSRGRIGGSPYLNEFVYAALPYNKDTGEVSQTPEGVADMFARVSAINAIIDDIYVNVYVDARTKVQNGIKSIEVTQRTMGGEVGGKYLVKTGLYQGADLMTKYYIQTYFLRNWEATFGPLWLVSARRQEYRARMEARLVKCSDASQRRVLEHAMHLLQSQAEGGMNDAILRDLIKVVLQTVLSPIHGTVRLVYKDTDALGRPVQVPFDPSFHSDSLSDITGVTPCVVTFRQTKKMGSQVFISARAHAIRFTLEK